MHAALAVALAVLPACDQIPWPDLPIPIPTPAPTSCWSCDNEPNLAGKLIATARSTGSRYIVVLKRRPAGQGLLSAQDVSSLALKFSGVSNVQAAPRLRQFTANVETLQQVAKILADPEVDFVEKDSEVRLIEPKEPLAPLAVTWGLDRVDQRALPLDGKYEPNGDGGGVKVAVIDTGVRQGLAELEGRLQAECFTAITFGECDDRHGHGTFCVGTVASKTYGVAKKALILNARVLDERGSGSTSGVVAGIEWAVQQGVDVISMSLGGPPDPALNRAVCAARAAGILVVVAAGNESADSCDASPAQVVEILTVGATDKGDGFAYFSNRGGNVDLNAPGVDVTSLAPGGGTDVMSGTSMACPHVAGAAALRAGLTPGLAPDQLRDAIVANATPDVILDAPSGTTKALLFVR
jgi:subtilisin family serine protease